MIAPRRFSCRFSTLRAIRLASFASLAMTGPNRREFNALDYADSRSKLGSPSGI
jgi:hypothetical protein